LGGVRGWVGGSLGVLVHCSLRGGAIVIVCVVQNPFCPGFGVLFPGKQSGIMGQLTFWWLSSVLLAIVTAYFGYLIWVVFKQKRLSEIQKDFVNNMAHEFKTPLATIALSAQMLEKMNVHNPHFDHVKYITAIKEESARLKKQVENTLHLSTENAADFQLKIETVSISALLEALINQLRNNPVFAALSIDFENNSHNDRVIGDAFHLENMFFNLIENAFKYNKNDRKLVSIRLENKDHRLVVAITDNGIGISAEKQKLIFNKFYRLNTGNLHDQKGFGLGLYYVQQIVRAHQGKVIVESQLHKGSSFSIYLPVSV
jgi:two-component system, OmpR family, phosphate regulon sensor histidine kinase PhoR